MSLIQSTDKSVLLKNQNFLYNKYVRLYNEVCLLKGLLEDGEGGGGIGVESDPIFTASPAFGITNANITQWNNNGVVDLSNYVDRTTAQSIAGSKTFSNVSTFTDTWANGQISIGSTGQAAKMTFVNGNNGIGGLTIGYVAASTPTAEMVASISGGLNIKATHPTSGQLTLTANGTSGNISFNTNSGEVMRLFPSGNVGIGTTVDDSSKLQVAGTSRFSGNSIFNSKVTFLDSWTNYQAIFGQANQAARVGFIDSNGAVGGVLGYESATGTEFMFRAFAQSSFFNGGVRTMTFTNNNNVLIGGNTNVGANKLQVTGNSRFVGDFIHSSAGNYFNYNTTDETTNFERVTIGWTANVFNISSNFGGTGGARGLFFGMGTDRGFSVKSSNSYIGRMNVNDPNAGGLGAIFGVSCVVNNSSGIMNIASVVPVISQTGTASYNALFISTRENTTGSGIKNLISAGINSGSVGDPSQHDAKFTVSNTGRLTFADAPIYADNAAATAAGLPVGTVYKTSTGVLMMRL